MASSSSVSSQGSQKYDVFLNFRGEDVRFNFLSHLIVAFDHASLNIFVDNKLERGEHIKSALMVAIQDSKVALTIFSEGYASSAWCLDELVKIMECRQHPMLRQKVIPVFYHVTASDVSNQSGVFAQDFAKHESDRGSHGKVPLWRAAMAAAADLSGRSVKKTSSEAHVLIQIVDDVLNKLGRNYPIPNPGGKMSFHASIHLHVFRHNLHYEISSKKLKGYPNIQQQQRNGSIWTISRQQGLPVQVDLNEFLMSIRGQVEGRPSESHRGGNNTNDYGLGGTTVPYSSVSMSNGNRLDLGNGNWGNGYPVDYGNGYYGYFVDLGNGNWSYYVVREDGRLYPYESDADEQAGEGPVKKRQKLKSSLKFCFLLLKDKFSK